MTQATMLILLEDMTGEVDADTLLAYLELAGRVVLNKCYPFDKAKTEVPECYQNVQVEVAAYLLNKRGAEGETVHNENGINRSYENGGIPASMLKQVVPFCGVPKGASNESTSEE